MTPTVSASPAGSLRKFLNLLQRAGTDLSPFMRWAAVVLADEVEQSFEGERTPSGQRWAPLAMSTANAFVTRARGSGAQRRGKHPILQVTGRLAASFETRFDQRSAWVGSNLAYARVQMRGGGPSNIPARNAMGLSAAGESELMDRATQWAAEYFRAAKSQAST